MKIDDGPLNHYLIKNLQSLTEADPSLLANYVAALLKNNKPKKELQKLCIDQLYDFLGDGTKTFVAKLFHALEDGTVPSSEDMEPSKPSESGSVVPSADVEIRVSSPLLERLPSTAVRSFSDQREDESSDDEDDDRNHKHRRRVTRSRSFDKDGEEDDRGLYRKRGRSTDNGHGLRDSERLTEERRGPVPAIHQDRDSTSKIDRRLGREHGAGRSGSEGGQRGPVRTAPQFRGEVSGPRYDGPNGLMRGGIGRGRGLGVTWPSHDQPFPPPPFPDGAEFAPPMVPPGTAGSGFFAGRGMPGRGVSHTPWPGYVPHPGIGNGPMEHPHSRSSGLQSGRGPGALSGAVGLNLNIGRPRCLDFEERGYCLRGDLCPMEHGANRIVVEDVQSLSKFNLPVTIPSGRGINIGPGSGPSSGPLLSSNLSLAGRGNRGSREGSSPPVGEDGAALNATGPTGAGAELDLYDPDQPLWNKERPDASSSIRKLVVYRRGSQESDWEGDLMEKRETRDSSDTSDIGRSGRLAVTNGTQGTEGGPSVWDRIGPVDRVGSRLDGGLRLVGLEGIPGSRSIRKEHADDLGRGRGGWQGKWSRDFEVDEEIGPRTLLPNSSSSRGRGGVRHEPGSGQRYGEGTSYGGRGTGGRGVSGFGFERAQRTLYVSSIPTQSNRTELLNAHFQKFGQVLDIRIPAHSDRAFVQFSRREEAESALTAPDAVMGNRFVRLSWANRDSIPDPGDTLTAAGMQELVKSRPVSARTLDFKQQPEKSVLNGNSEVGLSDGAVKLVAANGSAIASGTAGTALKKQEELEKMKEVIRKKQESLDQKRVDFRRKLEAKLAKQGPVQVYGSETEQSAKRQKVDNAEDCSSGVPKPVMTSNATSQPAANPAQTRLDPSSSGVLVKLSGSEAPKPVIGTGIMAIPAQPSPRAGRPQPTRGNGSSLNHPVVSWGPTRYKLDNRTTVFRVYPPFPSGSSDISVLKEHFAMFGEVPVLEVEDAGGQKVEGVTKVADVNTLRVSFATRRAAEKAFLQGRWFQGSGLQLSWITVSSGAGGNGGNPLAAIPRALVGAETGAGQDLADASSRCADRELSKSNQEIYEGDIPSKLDNEASEQRMDLIMGSHVERKKANSVVRPVELTSGDSGLSVDSGVEAVL